MRNKLKTKNSYLIKIPLIAEGKRGNLSFCEVKKQIPFNIKRVYWIYDVSSKRSRGEHAHKKNEQVLFCLQGSIRLELDDGINRDNIVLNKPNIGIFLGRKLWVKMSNFEKNTVLLILSSEFYDEKEYIRDYNVFKKILKNKYLK
jgi:mannose-6-phosphate isomerase-like protein (cupin superfamily)